MVEVDGDEVADGELQLAVYVVDPDELEHAEEAYRSINGPGSAIGGSPSEDGTDGCSVVSPSALDSSWASSGTDPAPLGPLPPPL